jgi:hypothetical protein
MTPRLIGAVLATALLAATLTDAAQSSGAGGKQNRPWSLEDALPSNSRALRHPVPEPTDGAGVGLGRVPLQGGSFGLETETKIKPDRLLDGRAVPGYETSSHPNQSYLGLSLSVPTDAKTILPVPSAPWVRPD